MKSYIKQFISLIIISCLFASLSGCATYQAKLDAIRQARIEQEQQQQLINSYNASQQTINSSEAAAGISLQNCGTN